MNEFTKTQNGIVEKHSSIIKADLRSKANMSADSFKVKTRVKLDRQTGLANRIGISFERHGVFVEKGVGRGRGINSGKTKPKEWFNPVIRDRVPQLAQELGESTADILLKTLIR